jgi:outer membrane protein assembly factor BamB
MTGPAALHDLRFLARRWCAILGVLIITMHAHAQAENPVYINDSPRAQELLLQALDQRETNIEETVRLFQELLDTHGDMLVPVSVEDTPIYQSVRQRIVRLLQADDALRTSYRQRYEPDARRLLRAGRWQDVWMRYPTTPAAAEAGIRLAQDDLEEGRFHVVCSRLAPLTRQPDLTDRQRAFTWYMIAVASHFLDDESGRQRAARALDQITGVAVPLHHALQRLTQQSLERATRIGRSPYELSPVLNLGEPVREPIWTVALRESLFERASEFNQPNDTSFMLFNRSAQLGQPLTITPVVDDTRVYLNQGHAILAIDRMTGEELWRYTERSALSVVDEQSELIMDVNHIALDQGALVTFAGHAYLDQRSNNGQILCLDAKDGTLRWRQSLSGIGDIEDHRDLFPHGQPLIVDDRVCVLARKVNDQRLCTSYIMALNLEDGSLAWSQPIASTGNFQVDTYRPFALIARHQDMLYVASPLGAVLAVQASTGDVQWLHRFDLPLNPPLAPLIPGPWSAGGPVVTEPTVITLTPDQHRIVTLDRQTGQWIAAVDARTRSRWNSPNYLLSNEHLLFGVGTDIRAADIDNHAVIRWHWPDTDDPDQHGIEPQILGRVQVTANALIVPTDQGVVFLDPDSGREAGKLPVQAPGHCLALDEQLIVASARRVDTYMSFDHAARMLRTRLARNADDPRIPLALLELGITGARLDVCLEAADAAYAVIDRLPDRAQAVIARDTMFSQLLEVTERNLITNPQEGEAVYERMALAADTAEQDVDYLLSYGRWLGPSDPQRSQRVLRRILEDPILRTVWRAEGSVERTAPQWATRSLQDLVETHGRAVLEESTRDAQQELDQLLAREHPDPDALRRLADKYPLCAPGTEAALAAAQAYLDASDHRQALGVLAASLRATSHRDPETTRRLLEQYLQLCVNEGLTEQARLTSHLAQRLAANTPDDSTRAPSSNWHELLSGFTSAPPDVHIGLQDGLVELLPGRLVPPHPNALAAETHEVALTVQNGYVAFIRAHGLTPVSRGFVNAEAPQWLALDDETALLWIGEERSDPRAILLNIKDGTERWVTPRLEDHLNRSIGDLARARSETRTLPDGTAFDSQETIPLINDSVLIMLRRVGGTAAAFDLRDPQQVRWTLTDHRRSLDEVYWSMLVDRDLVLAGRKYRLDERTGESTLAPTIMVIDAGTGRVVHQLEPLSGSDVLWMRPGPLSTLIFGTRYGIEALDLTVGRSVWLNIADSALASNDAWNVRDSLVMLDRVRALRRLDSMTGELSAPFAEDALGQWDPMDIITVQPHGEGCIAHHRQRMVSYDDAGRMTGADSVIDPREYEFMLPADSDIVVISRYRTEQVPIAGQSGRTTMRTYRMYHLARDGRLLEPAIELEPMPPRIRQATLLNGWILLSTVRETIAIPMPAP